MEAMQRQNRRTVFYVFAAISKIASREYITPHEFTPLGKYYEE